MTLESPALRLLAALAAVGARSAPSGGERILIARATSLGDFTNFLPCLRQLTERHPDAQVDLVLLSRVGAIAEHFALPDNIRIHTVDVRSLGAMRASARTLRVPRLDGRYDHVYYAGQSAEGFSSRAKKLIFLRHIVGWRVAITGFHARRAREANVVFEDMPVADCQIPVDACVRVMAPLPVDRSSVLNMMRYSSDDRESLSGRLAAALPGARRIAGVHAWAQFDRKRWPAARYAMVIQHLLSLGFDGIALLGGPADVDSAEALREMLPGMPIAVLAGTLSVRDSIFLAERLEMVVGNDGAPIHMAALGGARVVSVFCNYEPAGLWEPVLAPRSRSVRPVWGTRRPPTEYGIESVPLDAVIAAIDDVLRDDGAAHEIQIANGTELQRYPIPLNTPVFTDLPGLVSSTAVSAKGAR